MWYLSAEVHADVVIADVQMCLVQYRSCDHTRQMVMCIVIIKMAAKVKIQFYRFILQILLEYDASVSKKVFSKLIL